MCLIIYLSFNVLYIDTDGLIFKYYNVFTKVILRYHPTLLS